MASTAPAAVVAPRSPALERRLRQRRAEARIRLRILADSSLLSGHHASQVPRVAAAAARTTELAGVLADIANMRAELLSVRTQLTTALAEIDNLREGVDALVEVTLDPAKLEKNVARGEMDVEAPEASGGDLVPPAAFVAPLPSATASTETLGGQLQPEHGAAGPAGGPAGAQLGLGGFPASWLTEPRSGLLQPGP